VALTEAQLEDALPGGSFDLVVSVLAVHHLTDVGKADLFARVRARLAPGGRFVLGDVVVPRDPSRALVELEEGVDRPALADAQLAWLRNAGLDAHIAWERDDLAVLVGVVS
ncbi:MAG: hypothetical protein QOE63_1408, partial [Acidimicrobiaceae bacterium]